MSKEKQLTKTINPKTRRKLNQKKRRSVRACIKNYLKRQGNIDEFDFEETVVRN